MRTFNLVLKVTDPYDRYHTPEVIAEITLFLENLDLTVNKVAEQKDIPAWQVPF